MPDATAMTDARACVAVGDNRRCLAACESGDRSACVHLSAVLDDTLAKELALDSTKVAWLHDRPQQLEKEQCLQGDYEACAAIGHRRPPGPDELPINTYLDYARTAARKQCARGALAACVYVAQKEPKEVVPTGAISSARAACMATDARACVLLAKLDGIDAAFSHSSPLLSTWTADRERGLTLLRRAYELHDASCQRGDGDSCSWQASALLGGVLFAEKAIARSLELEARACRLGYGYGCARIVWASLPDGIRPDPAIAKLYTDRICRARAPWCQELRNKLAR
jgi:hypothetical protein